MTSRLSVKGWRVFQHYKDRSPAWIKLQKSLLDDYEFNCLPLASKALAPMIWLLASESDDGSVSADVKWIAFRLRWPERDVIDGLKPLISAGFLIDASNALADCYQGASPEKEERREEKEKSNVGSPCSPTVPLPLPGLEDPIMEPEANKPKRAPYPTDFELLWSEWPQNPNESKKTAFDRWKRLSADEKADCFDGAMAQAGWLAAETEKRRGKDPPPRIHLSTFISEKRWEALLQTEFNKYGRNPWQTQQQF